MSQTAKIEHTKIFWDEYQLFVVRDELCKRLHDKLLGREKYFDYGSWECFLVHVVASKLNYVFLTTN